MASVLVEVCVRTAEHSMEGSPAVSDINITVSAKGWSGFKYIHVHV